MGCGLEAGVLELIELITTRPALSLSANRGRVNQIEQGVFLYRRQEPTLVFAQQFFPVFEETDHDNHRRPDKAGEKHDYKYANCQMHN